MTCRYIEMDKAEFAKERENIYQLYLKLTWLLYRRETIFPHIAIKTCRLIQSRGINIIDTKRDYFVEIHLSNFKTPFELNLDAIYIYKKGQGSLQAVWWYNTGPANVCLNIDEIKITHDILTDILHQTEFENENS